MKPAKQKRTAPRRRNTGRAAAVRTESVRGEAAVAAAEAGSAEARTTDRRQEQGLAAGSLDWTAFDAWAESGAVLARGAEDIGKAWLRFTHQSVEEGTDVAKAILGAKTLRQAVELQNDYARNSFGNLVAESVRLSELSIRVAREAIEPIKMRLDAVGQRIAHPTA